MQGLLDHAPKDLAELIETSVEAIPGISDCHHVRVRTSGPGLFVDLHIYVDPNQSLKDAHLLAKKAAEVVRHLAPKADVIVHAEPNPEQNLAKEQSEPKS